jgi:Trp operon repressor
MKKTQQQVLELYKLILTLQTTKELEALLSDLLTPQEIVSVAERLQIIKALLYGKTQRDIANGLKTSIGKVTRGSRIFQFGKSDWKKILNNF